MGRFAGALLPGLTTLSERIRSASLSGRAGDSSFVHAVAQNPGSLRRGFGNGAPVARRPQYCRSLWDPTVFVYTLLISAPQKNSCAE